MVYVVGEKCEGCKYTVCVDVCPVDAFHESDTFLTINPDTCISCGVCEPECPADAIYDEKFLPIGELKHIETNRALSKINPVLFVSKPAFGTSID